jgi:hypothetical protein
MRRFREPPPMNEPTRPLWLDCLVILGPITGAVVLVSLFMGGWGS